MTFGIGLAAVIGVAYLNSSAGPPEPPESRDPREMACYAAQLAVKQKLASPSAAKFPSCRNSGSVQADGPNKYIVRSIFEIPDSSGIMRQHGYVVSVTDEGANFRTFILGIQ